MSSGIVCILPGSKHVYRREDAGPKWCFRCRKRLSHEAVLIGDPPPPERGADMAWNHASFDAWLDEGYGYYDPSWSLRCSGCGEDYTAFPGTIP
jgi:hypothetical protein